MVGLVLGVHCLGWQVCAQTDRITTTPLLLQKGFGRGGSYLPGDGEVYCTPTAHASSLLWMHLNGYDRLWDQPYQTVEVNQTNLVRALAGLMQTNPRGGTFTDNSIDGIETYLKMKGYGDFLVGYYSVIGEEFSENITLAMIDGYNTGYGYGNINWGWYVKSEQGYVREGGHSVTYLGSNGSNQIIIGNPAPFVKGVNPEYLNVYRETEGNLTKGLLLDLSGLENLDDMKAMIDAVVYVIPTRTPENAQTVVAWQISETEHINTNGAYMTVQAPIYGAGKLSKQDFGSENGVLVLTAGAGGEANPYTYSGGTLVAAGTLVGENASGTPFGTGSLELLGGELWVAPEGSGEEVTVYGATDPSAVLSVGRSGTIVLDRGDHESLTFIVGSHTDGMNPNLVQSVAGSFLIGAGSGLAELGNRERLILSGSMENLPALFHGVVATWILGVDVGSSYQGAFLTYNMQNGFVVADIQHQDFSASQKSDLVEITSSQQITGTGRAYGVVLQQGVTLSGTGSMDRLLIGDDSVQRISTLVLNGATLALPVLEFDGASSGLVYVSGQGGRIESTIRATGGLGVNGSGILELTRASDYSGGTYVYGGVLSVRNATGSATGSEKVFVYRNGGLMGNGRVGGTVDNEGILVAGYEDSGKLVPATLSIGGDLIMRTNSIYQWSLGILTDADMGGVAGLDWGLIEVAGKLIVNGLAYVELIFPEGHDPETGGAFWQQDRFWKIATAMEFENPTNLSVFGKKYQYGVFFLEVQGNALGISYIVIPEPAFWVVSLAAIVAVFVVIRRTRREV